MGSIFLAACIVALISAPFNMMVELVLRKAVFRHVHRESDDQGGVDSASFFVWCCSFFYSGEEDFVRLRTRVDLKNFEERLLQYRQMLLGVVPRELRSFDRIWGLT